MSFSVTLSKVSKKLLFREPFYGLFLIQLQKESTTAIPTAAVSKHNLNFKLSINEEFFNSLPDKHKEGLLKHELLHITNGHLFMADKFYDKKLFNIAADCYINQYIDEEYLPEGGIKLSNIEEIVGEKLETFAGTEYYYNKLSKFVEENKSNFPKNNPPSEGSGENDSDSIYEALGKEIDVHDWKDFSESSESAKKIMEKTLESIIKNVASQTRGNLPREIQSILEDYEIKAKAKFDWAGYMRRFVGRSTITYTKKTRRKPSKRFKGNPGLRIKFKSHICVGIDVSASVSNESLIEFFNEIHHLSKLGHKITIIQCDTNIADISDYKRGSIPKIHARGGTDFQPVIDHYNKSNSYTCLIYMTDGECYAPKNAPSNILWVIDSVSELPDHLPGQTIKLDI